MIYLIGSIVLNSYLCRLKLLQKLGINAFVQLYLIISPVCARVHCFNGGAFSS